MSRHMGIVRAAYGNSLHRIHFSEDELSDVYGPLKPHLLVKAHLSGLVQSQSV